MTRPYAEVIGDPIAHSKSPLIHNFWLAKLGIDAEYRARHVRAGDLSEYLTQRSKDAQWRGCNVTVPHKVAAIAHIRVSKGVRDSVGAINTVIPTAHGKADGANTDIEGVVRPLEAIGTFGRTMAIIGAGGAARAAVVASMAIGVETLFVLNRTEAKARAMLDAVRPDAKVLPLLELLPPVEIVINASSLGMAGQPRLLLALDHVASGGIVFDMVYTPLETPLLREARRRGLRTIDGLQMLVAQGAAAFELFFGQPAPREHDGELRALLTA